MGLRIRDSRLDDAEAVARFHLSCFRQNFRGVMAHASLDSIDEKAWLEQRKTNLARPERVKLVAEVEGRVVGFCDGGATRDPHYCDCGELYALYVDPAHQGGGVGKTLVHEMKKRLQAQGYRRMFVKTHSTSPANRRFYASLGGIERGWSTFYFDGQWYPEVGFVYDLV